MKRNPVLFFLLLIFFSCNEEKKNIPATHQQADTIATDSAFSKNFYDDLSYATIDKRSPHVLKNDSLKQVVDTWFTQHRDGLRDTGTLDSLIDFLLEVTKAQLSFSFGKCDSDPEKLVRSKKANCVGYAAYFNTLCNYALEKQPFAGNYFCTHYVGKIYFGQQEVNTLFKDPFFKDHDFCIVSRATPGNEIVVDPSLYEYLGVRRVRLKK